MFWGRLRIAVKNVNPSGDMEDTKMRLTRSSPIVWGLVAAVLWAGVFLAPGTSFAARSVQCDNYARDYADRHSGGGSDVVGGALGGAATGALLGGIIGGGGGAAKGAAIGGGVGALGGTAAAGSNWSRAYNRAYDRCMNGE